MLNQSKPHNAKYQDGSSRSQKAPEALAAERLNFEQREVVDWLRFAQDFSRLVHYYNDQNESDGYWDGFLTEDPQAFAALTQARDQESAQEAFRQLLARYLEGYVPVNADAEVKQRLQAPHRALFLAFLKLLEHLKEQFNALPQRHLDFHFRELLGFTGLPARPDEVHVQVRPEEEATPFHLEAGTTFVVPQEEGEDILYKSDHELVVNHVTLAQVHQLFLEKTVETVDTVRLNHRSEADDGFQKLMEFVLGADGPATPLPPFPGDEEDLMGFYEALEPFKNISKEERLSNAWWQYLEHSLYMPFEAFEVVIYTQRREMDPLKPAYPNAWQRVNEILIEAYLTREVAKRKEALRKAFEEAEAEKAKTGFNAMLIFAFGVEGDLGLSPYNNGLASADIIYQDLTGASPGIDQSGRARQYLLGEWSMPPQNFEKLYGLMTATARTETDWDEALLITEAAMREQKRIKATAPELVKIGRLRASSPDHEIRENPNGNTSHLSQPLFGNPAAPEARMGWRLSSPSLILKEGRRTIDWYLRLQGEDLDRLPDLFKQPKELDAPRLFDTELVAEGKAHLLPEAKYSFGNFVLQGRSEQWKASLSDGNLVVDANDTVTANHEGLLVLFPNGDLYKLGGIVSPQVMSLTLKATLEGEDLPASGRVWLYHADAIFYQSIRVSVPLPVEFPALKECPEHGLPELRMTINSAYEPDLEELTDWKGTQHALRGYKLDRMHLNVEVFDLEIQALQNDFSTLEAKTPYLPFGDPCVSGNTFYFSHDELASKPLQRLDLHFEWPKVPASFKDHYKKYYDYLIESDPKHANSAYHARLDFKDRHSQVMVKEGVPLFADAPAEGETVDNQHHLVSIAMSDEIQARLPGYDYRYDEVNTGSTPLDWSRCFVLEYTGVSFLNEEYNLVQVPFYAQFQTDPNAKAPEPLPKPYVPKLKKLLVNYQTAETFLFGSDDNGLAQVSWCLPFGGLPLPAASEEALPLVYPYEQAGELYLGLKGARVGDTVSILFQFADGSTPADVPKPTLQWCYQSAKGWKELPETHQLHDATEGLSQTGIKIVQLPPDAAKGSTELNADWHWLKAVAPVDAQGLPEFVALLTGVAHAIQSGPAPSSHYRQPLPPESIDGLIPAPTDVQAVYQPFSSARGMAPEDPDEFYLRVSKRLRHKDRVLTMWDYEQSVLSQFPEVYKVKCLSADHSRFESPGSIKVIVIPDVRGKIPFAPLQPKMAEYQLTRIGQYLEQLAPPYADISVEHPRYLQVKARLGVRLKAGFQPELSLAQLNQSIKRFLSPWAFDADDEVSFGGEVYANALIGYIENLPYVDYIVNIKLFQSENGVVFKELYANDGFLKVSAETAQTILVSAESHELDLIGEDGYVVENFSGINFDKIELDFHVGG